MSRKIRFTRLLLAILLLPFIIAINFTTLIFSKCFKGKFIKTALFISFLFSSLVFSCIAIYVYLIWHKDISIDGIKNYNPVVSSKLYYLDGSLMTELGNERRTFVKIEDIPQIVQKAFISAEDRTFYKNRGVDIQGLTRAMLLNCLYLIQGKKLQGASTITQQVIRNTVLSRERTIDRKLKEMVLAYKISHIMTKDEIMEVYLNQIYLGSGAYGVEAASKEYFDKTIKNLSIEEAALLASLPKAPSTLDPRKGKKATIARRNWIIRSMFEEGYIQEPEMDKAINTFITLSQKKIERKPYSFIEYVYHFMESAHGMQKEELDKSGYDIRSTLDREIYDISLNAFNNGILKYDRKHGYKGPIDKCKSPCNYQEYFTNNDELERLGSYEVAIVENIDNEFAHLVLNKNYKGKISFDNMSWAKPRMNDLDVGEKPNKVSDILSVGDVIVVNKVNGNNDYELSQIPEVDGSVVVMRVNDGAIVSMVGSYLDIPGAFNRAYQAKRQPGSVAKTFSYLTLLENGFTPADMVVDSAIVLNVGDGKAYTPSNFNKQHIGAMTVRRAFEKSLNTPLIRMMYEIGPDKLVEVLNRLGVSKTAEPIMASSIGSFETTLLDILHGYTTILNCGKDVSYTPILSYSKGSDGKMSDKNPIKVAASIEIEDIIQDFNTKPGESIIDPRIAYQVISLLQGAATRGTASSFGKIAPNLFGKTGTTDDAKDLWFIGGSSDFVIGVYVGYDIPSSLGKQEYGGTTAMPIAIDIIKEIIKKYKPAPFKVPEGINFVNIDMNTGMPTKFNNSRVITEAFKASDVINKKIINMQYKSDEGSDQDIPSGVY